MQAKLAKITTTRVVLTMTTKEAIWLHKIMKKPLTDKEEAVIDFDNRLLIAKALEIEGVICK